MPPWHPRCRGIPPATARWGWGAEPPGRGDRVVPDPAGRGAGWLIRADYIPSFFFFFSLKAVNGWECQGFAQGLTHRRTRGLWWGSPRGCRREVGTFGGERVPSRLTLPQGQPGWQRWREAELSQTHRTGGLELAPSIRAPVAPPVRPVTAATVICTAGMWGHRGLTARDGHLHEEGHTVTKHTQPQGCPPPGLGHRRGGHP